MHHKDLSHILLQSVEFTFSSRYRINGQEITGCMTDKSCWLRPKKIIWSLSTRNLTLKAWTFKNKVQRCSKNLKWLFVLAKTCNELVFTNILKKFQIMCPGGIACVRSARSNCMKPDGCLKLQIQKLDSDILNSGLQHKSRTGKLSLSGEILQSCQVQWNFLNPVLLRFQFSCKIFSLEFSIQSLT